MKRVAINIDDDLYDFIIDHELLVMDLPEIERAIKHGIVLPEEHENEPK